MDFDAELHRMQCRSNHENKSNQRENLSPLVLNFRVRLIRDKVHFLLSGTHWPNETIATAAGWSSARHTLLEILTRRAPFSICFLWIWIVLRWRFERMKYIFCNIVKSTQNIMWVNLFKLNRLIFKPDANTHTQSRIEKLINDTSEMK